jgi:chaperonin GroEL (HSP60 family)
MRLELASVPRNLGDFQEMGVVFSKGRSDNRESSRSVERDNFVNDLSSCSWPFAGQLVFVSQIRLKTHERAMRFWGDVDGGVIGDLKGKRIVRELLLHRLLVDGIERIAAATGAEILSTFDAPDRADKVLGGCKLIEEIMIGEDKLIKFGGCKVGEACTIVLRGASSHILDEAERSLHDALCVLVQTVKNRRVIYGGGNAEMRMSIACDELAKQIKGKQALAIEAYARALRQLPTILADNGGYDSAELVQELKVELNHGNKTAGINMYKGQIGNMEELGVTECLRVKEQALMSASEAAEMILRVDDIIRCAPRQRERM